MADLSVFSRLKTKEDFDREAERWEMEKQVNAMKIAQLGRSGVVDQPAALQLTNEYLSAVDSGDTRRANAIADFAKVGEKWMNYSAATGIMPQTQQPSFTPAIPQVMPDRVTVQSGVENPEFPNLAEDVLPPANIDLTNNPYIKQGYLQGLSAVTGAKKAAELQQELGYKPAIAGREAQAKADVEYATAPQIQAAKTTAEAFAKNKAETTTELGERISMMPQLEATVNKLSELGKIATYTKSGQVLDIGRAELGLAPRQSAIARKEYISLVDNQILPLLRQTFGAQFTQREGESLKATLGDPNATPEEKDAVLRSFIDQKKQTIAAMQRKLGFDESMPPALPEKPQIPAGATLYGTSGGKNVYKLPNGKFMMEQ